MAPPFRAGVYFPYSPPIPYSKTKKPAGKLRHVDGHRTATSGQLELRAVYPTNLVTVHRTRQNLRLSSEKRLSTGNQAGEKIRGMVAQRRFA